MFQGGVVGGRGGRAVFASFCPSPATIFFLSSVSWASSWNFGGVFEGRDPQMCTFGVLGLLCEASAAQKPPSLGEAIRERAVRGTPVRGKRFGQFDKIVVGNRN